LSEIKGLPVLIDALAQCPGVSLDVVGRGYVEATAREMVHRKGLDARVKFHGMLGRDATRDIVHRSVCVVVPSRYPEPFGLVGPEAMAAARPVIASDIGGIPEWLEDGVSGHLVAPNYPAELAVRINELVKDRENARRMGLAGRRIWEERFHPSLHVAALLDSYRTAIQEFTARGVDG
jgi:glycosyltransferase involved in cell wall biosynthesis